MFVVEGNDALRKSTQQKLPNMQIFERRSQPDKQNFDWIIVLNKIDFLDEATENQMFKKYLKTVAIFSLIYLPMTA